MRINLGDIAKDAITGFKGTVIARTEYLYNCDRLTLQPKGLKDGKRYDCATFDEPAVELVEHAEKAYVPLEARGFGLGDTVRDTITGLEGVVVSRTEWLERCDRYGVQPTELHNGEVIPASSIEGSTLEPVKRGKFVTPQPAAKTGGPMAEPRR